MISQGVLVTGAGGYLGGNIVSALERDGGWRVRCGLRTGAATAGSPGQEQVEIDLESGQSLETACRDVEAVVHLAAPNEIDSARDPVAAVRQTTAGTVQLLEACRRTKVRRVLYMSTAHVYGSPLSGIVTEATPPRPIHPYAITHRAAEDFVLAAHIRGELTGLVLRLSNGIGAPRAARVNRWTLLVNDLCRQAVVSGTIMLRSQGKQQRDFVGMTDVAGAVAHFLRLAPERCGDGLFNVGSGVSRTVAGMAEMVAECCQAVLGYRPQVMRPTNVVAEAAPEFSFSITKARETGFQPSTSLETEINATLRFCHEHRATLSGAVPFTA